MSNSFKNMPWRPTYEFYSAMGWISAVILLFIGAESQDLPMGPFWYMALAAVAFFAYNMKHAWEIWTFKFSLTGKGIEFVRIKDLLKLVKKLPNRILLGYGFDWKLKHTQHIYNMKKYEPSEFFPPDGFLRVKEFFSRKKIASLDQDMIGAPWIHGVEPEEIEITVPNENLIGNTLIVGVTRCGKTRLLDWLITQFTKIGDACIFIVDPKGDRELRDNIERAAIDVGRGADFLSFHLGFPSQSIRIDPLKNYVQPSELASRVVSPMPSDSGDGDSFTAFAFAEANAIFLGMLDIGEKPTLLALRQYIESGIEPLLMRCLPAFFAKMESQVPGWEKLLAIYISKSIRRDSNGEMPNRSATYKETLVGHLLMYNVEYKSKNMHSEAIEALVSSYEHPADHKAKMLANFKPLLTMLTTGEMAGLLSPDVEDIGDERLATDFASLANGKKIVYIGLNALSNKTVASAVGSMFLSDWAALAALRLNYGSLEENKKNPIYTVTDEGAQVVNDAYIQILNMTSGAGFINLMATQTISDLVSRLGSEEKARVMLGNFNNVFALRTKDRATQDFIVESFGTAYVFSKQTTQATTSTTEQSITHYTGNIGERISETLEDLIPTDLLGKLPNMHYFASIAGGRIVKGRVPILIGDDE